METRRSFDNTKRSRRPFFAALGLTAAITFSGNALSIVWAQKKPIKIGNVAMLSGAYSWYAEDHVRGLEMVIEEINKKGGVLGREVKVITEDCGLKPAVAVAKLRKLIVEDEVDLVVGCPTSSGALAMGEIAERHNILVLFPANGADEITGTQCRKVIFRTNYSASYETNITTKYVAEELPEVKAVLGLGEDYIGGRSGIEKAEKSLTKYGKQWLGALFVPLGTTEWSAQITEIKKINPDLLFVAVGATIDSFYRQAHAFGLTGKMRIANGWSLHIRDVRASGEGIVGSIGSVRYAPEHDYGTEESHNFLKTYQTKYGTDPIHPAPDTYAAVKMLVKAIEKAGSTKTQAVVNALEGLSMNTLYGDEWTVRECDHQGVRPGYAGRVVESEKYPYPVIKIVKKYPGDEVAPKAKESGCKFCK